VTSVTSPARGQVLFLLILTTFFWGGSFLFTKIGAQELPPSLFVLLRFSLASLLMVLLCLPRLRRLNRVIIMRGLIVGSALAISNLTFAVGVKGTSISRAGVLNNLFVLFIPLIARILWKDRIGPAHLSGIIMACAGIGLLAGGGSAGFSQGDIISTLCAFSLPCISSRYRGC